MSTRSGEPPRGTIRFVKDHWDRIDDVVTKALRKIEPRLDSALAGIDFANDMYGCGVWGCAYPTNLKGYTVKVTIDPNEGPVAYQVLRSHTLRNHPGCAYMLGVWQLRQKRADRGVRPIYVILREDIIPIDTLDPRSDELLAAEQLVLMKLVSAQLNKYIHEGADEEEFQRVYEYWLDMIRILKVFKETRQIAYFMEEFYEKIGIVLADVHIGNVGKRKGQQGWVVYDLGHSDLRKKLKIPLVKNPPIVLL